VSAVGNWQPWRSGCTVQLHYARAMQSTAAAVLCHAGCVSCRFYDVVLSLSKGITGHRPQECQDDAPTRGPRPSRATDSPSSSPATLFRSTARNSQNQAIICGTWQGSGGRRSHRALSAAGIRGPSTADHSGQCCTRTNAAAAPAAHVALPMRAGVRKGGGRLPGSGRPSGKPPPAALASSAVCARSASSRG